MEDLETQQPPVAQPTVATTAPVFYSLAPEEAPRPTPWYRKRQLVVMAVSFAVALFVIGGVVIFASNWFAQKNAPAKIAAEEASSMLADKVSACDQALDPETCKNGAGMQVANATGTAEVCNGLTGELLDSCVSLAARAAASISACGKLDGAAKTACEDGAYNAEAQTKNDLTLCAKIVDQALALGCGSRVTEAALANNSCVASHVDPVLCSDRQSLLTAMNSGLESACTALSDEEARIDCINGIHSLDVDGDGLSVFDEVNTHHTDPVKPDTDGDGYTDGDEVSTGHDPLKK
ncbi:MAG: thrombospondin type 3 repeat-containing protein [Patescibacteria group bacterium]|jgi:hypothetical protein